MGELSIWKLLVVLVIALLIFGPGKLKDLGKAMGEGIRNFKDSMKDGEKPPENEKK
ncbi:MAG: twin-arginine translocase TatA/TatE family subunit [Candidatus Acidiferrum sp.]